MKKFLLLLTILTAVAGFSQDFEKKWEKVILFEIEGKVKSASEEVDKIYALSKNKKNEVQIIKTFFYRSKFLLQKEENAQAEILANLNSEIEVASEPAKAILKTIYAKCLKDYLSENYYQIKNRTSAEINESNFKPWTEKNFINKIDELLNFNFSSNESLKKTPLENYAVILNTETSLKNMTVYEYVINSKAETYTYLLSKKYSGRVPSLDNLAKVIYSVEDFKNFPLDNIEIDLVAKLFGTYQELEKNDPNNFNLILKRVEDLKKLFDKNDKLYLNFLNQLQKRTTDGNLQQHLLLKKAQLYVAMAGDQEHSTHYASAMKVLDSILANQNRSNIYKQAILLKDEITSKHLSIDLASIIYKNENARTFIRFKNTDSILIKFYEIPRFINAISNRIHKDTLVLNHIHGKNPTKILKMALPKTADFYLSSTEILLPKLEIGNYVAIVQDKNKPLTLENIYYNFIIVSDMVPSYFSTKDEEIFRWLIEKQGFQWQTYQ